MKKRAALALAALAPAFAGIAFAQQPAPPAPSFAAPNLTEAGVRAMAATCSPCHGTNGRPAPGSTVAALAGRNDIAELMKAFKEGKRDATIMHQIAKGFSDAETEALASYFAKQAR
jgi:sulfide dehydrogenase cytochrome subunit